MCARGLTSERFRQLDGIRGLAALSVVLCHVGDAIPSLVTLVSPHGLPEDIPTRLLLALVRLPFAGAEAVVLFFVLSGFVLAIPYGHARAPSYAAFLVRRLFRIYLPYLVAMVAAAALVWLIRPQGLPAATSWLNSNWTHMAGQADVWQTLAAWDLGQVRLDGPVWSLEHELRISLAFPLIALFVRRVRWMVATCAAIWLLLGAQWLTVLPQPIVDSLHYAGLFVAGAALAVHRAWVTRLIERMPGWGRSGLLIVAVCLYDANAVSMPSIFLPDLTIGLGACLLICCAIGDVRIGRALSRPLPQWLGRMSFSLYLTHVPALLAMIYGLHALMPVPVAALLAIPVAFGVCMYWHRFIEAPAHAWGRRLTAGPGPCDFQARVDRVRVSV